MEKITMSTAKFFCLMLCLCLLLAACAPSDPLDEVSAELGADLSTGTLVYTDDSHGGFHGDGVTVIQIVIPELSIPQNDYWHPFPLSENLSRAFYGESGESSTVKPLFTDEAGRTVLPQIENGCYFFRDRHSQSADPSDDSALFSRFSWNFTAAVYDFDTGTLFFFKIDT